MSKKSKGINAERELIHLFWNKNWASIRVAGSGSIKYPCPDILAGNNIRKLAIECKTTKDNKKYMSMQDIEQLTTFSKIFGAEPWIAVKLSKEGWYFISPEDLNQTENGFVIDISLVRNKGLIFDELIGNFL